MDNQEVIERLTRLEAMAEEAASKTNAQLRILDELRKEIGGFNLNMALLASRVEGHDKQLAALEREVHGNGKKGLKAKQDDHERRIVSLEEALRRSVRTALWVIGLVLAPVFTSLGVFLAMRLGLR